MRIGCCSNMCASGQDGTGVEVVEMLEQAGYDYIELPLAQLMALDSREFSKIKERIFVAGLKCEACNNFFPGHMRLTGSDVDMNAIMDYVETAADRASQMGAEIIVFGSSGARNVPPGFALDKAWGQIVELLRNIHAIVKKHGIVIAIEHLNKNESNIINTVEDGLKLAREVNRDNVGLLVDFYHLSMEKEKSQILLKAGDYVKHIHFADPEGRVFPKDAAKGSYCEFFRCLKLIGYNKRISVEAYTKDFSKDAPNALHLLKMLANG